MQDFAETLRSLWVVWLVLLFTAIVAWAYWPSRRKRFQRDAEIPFKDDEERRP